MRMTLRILLAIAAFAPAAHAHQPADVTPVAAQTGLASYYAQKFEGLRTASGEIFRHAALIAAHPTWPLGTLARVTHLGTGRSVDVRINDRGPSAAPRREGVIIDLSHRAARELDMMRAGRARVSVEVLEWGSHGR